MDGAQHRHTAETHGGTHKQLTRTDITIVVLTLLLFGVEVVLIVVVLIVRSIIVVVLIVRSIIVVVPIVMF